MDSVSMTFKVLATTVAIAVTAPAGDRVADKVANIVPFRAQAFDLQDVRDQIARILDPKFAPPAAPQNLPIIFGLDGQDESAGCWLDYAIRVER